jgi:uncharacterized integral membrane protein
VALGYAIVAIVSALVAVFALQNSEPTRVRLLVWSVDEVPLAALILASLAAGMLVVGLPLWVQRWRLRARARALEARVAALEAAAPPREPRPPSRALGP